MYCMSEKSVSDVFEKGNVNFLEFRSKSNWPIRKLYFHVKQQGVCLDTIMPFECFREALIQKYINFERRRKRLGSVKRKYITSRLSKTHF